MVAVFVVVFVTAFNDWRKEKQFRGLRDCIEDQRTTSVMRNGVMKQVNIRDLLVGDICCIKYGDLIPADGLIVQASDLKIDESSLTGESTLVKKDQLNDPIILSGFFLFLDMLLDFLIKIEQFSKRKQRYGRKCSFSCTCRRFELSNRHHYETNGSCQR